jgi:hypothetical protein
MFNYFESINCRKNRVNSGSKCYCKLQLQQFTNTIDYQNYGIQDQRFRKVFLLVHPMIVCDKVQKQMV